MTRLRGKADQEAEAEFDGVNGLKCSGLRGNAPAGLALRAPPNWRLVRRGQ